MKYVYCLFDPRNELPFYVGMGGGNRCFSHLKETKDNTQNIRKYYKIQSIREDGFEPRVEIVKSNLTAQEAWDYEVELIAKYGRKDIDENGILMNISPGGEGNLDGMKGKKHTEKAILKIKEARQHQAPHNFTDDERKHIADKVTEYHANMTEERKSEIADKISKANKGVPKPAGHCTDKTKELRRANMKGKKLHPITRKWVTIEEYNTFILHSMS